MLALPLQFMPALPAMPNSLPFMHFCLSMALRLLRGARTPLPAALMLLLVSACQAPQQSSTMKPLDFSAVTPVTLDVARIEIDRSYAPPAKYPHVEHLFPTPPYEAVEDWAAHKFRASGGENVLTVEIREAGAVEAPLATRKGVKGWFTVEPSERYDGKLEVGLRLYAPGSALAKAEASTSIAKTVGVREDASLEEREKTFQLMTQEMILMMDKELQRQIATYFGPYIVR